MKKFLFALCALTLTASASAPALGAARNYDCSKPGNSNKAACKGANKAAPAAKVQAAQAQANAKAAKAQAKANAKAVKAQAKADAKAAKPTAASKAAAPAAPAKPSLLQRMKNAITSSTSTAPAKRAAPPRRSASAAPASAEDRNPAGAIAQCKDGTYSHSKVRSGACSRHGGVAKWS